MVMTQKSTRDRIVLYLGKVRLASVAELSRALNFTHADIRYHLHDLISENQVSWLPIGMIKSITGRGRPARQYFLTMQAKQDNLARLTLAVLKNYLPDTNSELVRNKKFRQLAATLSPPFTPPSANITIRLKKLIQWLNENHYQARWEARSSGPCILFENCPYIKILAQFPELCELDRAILSYQTGEEVTLVETIDPQKSEIKACLFTLENK